MAVHLYLLMSTNIKLNITALLARKKFDFIICSCNEENNERTEDILIIPSRILISRNHLKSYHIFSRFT